MLFQLSFHRAWSSFHVDYDMNDHIIALCQLWLSAYPPTLRYYSSDHTNNVVRKEFMEEVIELRLTDHIFYSTLLSHPFIYGLSSKRAGKVNGQFVRHVVSNSLEIYWIILGINCILVKSPTLL